MSFPFPSLLAPRLDERRHALGALLALSMRHPQSMALHRRVGQCLRDPSFAQAVLTSLMLYIAARDQEFVERRVARSNDHDDARAAAVASPTLLLGSHAALFRAPVPADGIDVGVREALEQLDREYPLRGPARSSARVRDELAMDAYCLLPRLSPFFAPFLAPFVRSVGAAYFGDRMLLAHMLEHAVIDDAMHADPLAAFATPARGAHAPFAEARLLGHQTATPQRLERLLCTLGEQPHDRGLLAALHHVPDHLAPLASAPLARQFLSLAPADVVPDWLPALGDVMRRDELVRVRALARRVTGRVRVLWSDAGADMARSASIYWTFVAARTEPAPLVAHIDRRARASDAWSLIALCDAFERVPHDALHRDVVHAMVENGFGCFQYENDTGSVHGAVVAWLERHLPHALRHRSLVSRRFAGVDWRQHEDDGDMVCATLRLLAAMGAADPAVIRHLDTIEPWLLALRDADGDERDARESLADPAGDEDDSDWVVRSLRLIAQLRAGDG